MKMFNKSTFFCVFFFACNMSFAQNNNNQNDSNISNIRDLHLENRLFMIRNGKENKMYYVNIDGKRVSDYYEAESMEYDQNGMSKGNYYKTRRNGLYGVIDSLGNDVFSCQFDYNIYYYGRKQFGITRITGNDGFREKLIDDKGYTLIGEMRDILNTGKGYICRNEQGYYGYYDYNINLKLPFDYSYMSQSEENENIIKLNDNKYVNLYGEFISPPVIPNDNKLILFKGDNDMYGYKNTKGKVVIPCKYKEAGHFSEGVAYVRNTPESYSYINREGREVIHLLYDKFDFNDIYEFHGGIAPIKKNGKCGFIDKNGKVIIPLQFDYENYYREIFDIIPVKTDNDISFINKKGQTIISNLKDYEFHKDFVFVTDANNNNGIFGKKGKVILPCIYSNYYYTIIPSVLKVKMGSSYGYFDTSILKEVVPCIYDEDIADMKFVEYARKISQIVEIDENIPNTSPTNTSTFAVIIGNERYTRVAQVPYANNDARIFAEYCKKTLGLPDKNVKVYENATYGTMIGAVSDMQKIAKAFKGDANIIFYYAGHGIPDEATGDGYLLPIDADGLNMRVCYPLSQLYKELGEMQARSVTCFLDACFSGSQRGDGMVVAARGVAIKAKSDRPTGHTIVFTAATDKQTAYPYKEKGHGMFTYYLLKKLRDTKGDCTLGELGSYICDEVAKQAVVTNGKEQTPVVLTSDGVLDNWKNMKLK